MSSATKSYLEKETIKLSGGVVSKKRQTTCSQASLPLSHAGLEVYFFQVQLELLGNKETMNETFRELERE